MVLCTAYGVEVEESGEVGFYSKWRPWRLWNWQCVNFTFHP